MLLTQIPKIQKSTKFSYMKNISTKEADESNIGGGGIFSDNKKIEESVCPSTIVFELHEENKPFLLLFFFF